MIEVQENGKKKYVKLDMYYKENMVTWEIIQDAMTKLRDIYNNIPDNTFTFIGPLRVIESIIPKDAIKTVSNIPNTNLTIWKYWNETNGYKVVFVGDTTISDTILSFVQEREREDSDNESKSTK